MRLNTYILPIFVVALLVLQLTDASRTWTILLVGLGGAWLVAFVWARSLYKNLHVERAMRYDWAQVGDKLEERFTLTNRGIFPATWVEVEDHSTMPGYAASVATGVDGMAENEWLTNGTCKRRGLYWLGGTSVRTGDPLGVYTITVENPARAMMIVMPPVIPLPQIEITPGGYMGEGRPRPNAPEYTVGAASVRQYASGDSLRMVHWPTSARRDELFVRLFDGAPAGDWWIVLDLNQSVQVGTGNDATEEHGIILAASLTDRGLRARKGVGLAASSEKLTWIPPQPGDSHKWSIMRALAMVNGGNTPLAELLERIRPNLGRRSSLVLITADTDPAWVDHLIPLTWRGITPTVLLLDPLSFGGTSNMAPLAAMLGEVGITRHLIDRGLLNRPEARPGHKGQWEWRVTPRGRAIPVHTPGDATWRRLG